VVVPSPADLSLEAEREEEADRLRLRAIERQLSGLKDRRRGLVDRVQAIASQQRELYDRRQAAQAEVDALRADHARIGDRMTELRAERDVARQRTDSELHRRRERVGGRASSVDLDPAAIRREIVELELHQQTQSLSVTEENALLARLRQRTKDLSAAEARAVVRAGRDPHPPTAGAPEVRSLAERIALELEAGRDERSRLLAEIGSRVEGIRGVVAEMRAKGSARAALAAELDALSSEIAALEQEGRTLLERTRVRREDARRTVETYTRSSPEPAREIAAGEADARLDELRKRGKLTLGG